MIYGSPPKRDLSLDSALMGGSERNGMRFAVRGSRLAVHCSPFTVHRSPFIASNSRSNENGFTLIEVIAALMIIAVLAAMIFPVTGSGLWRTARGVGECRELFELQGQMEEIVEAYKAKLSGGNGGIDLEDFLSTEINGSGYSVDSNNTGFLEESGNNLILTATPTSVLLVTLTAGDQRIASIFSK